MLNKIVLATNSPHKLREITEILSPTAYKIIPQSDFSIPEAEEIGLSFVENAILKARNAARYANLPAVADDSGLEIDALNGRPGIYSARYAGKNAADKDNNAKVLNEMRNIPENKRNARFQCVIAFLKHVEDPSPFICQGIWEGNILFEERGKNGFGYDPLFFVPTHNCSAAELPQEVKNKISHRGQALSLLRKFFADMLQKPNSFP